MLAGQLARSCPEVEVDPAVALGAAAAADTARKIVMPPQRDGGQDPFIDRPDPLGGDSGSAERAR